jgi:hypothetical protein
VNVPVLDDTPLTFSTREACAAAGVTFRMADYWIRRGAITPTVDADGCGTRRGWTVRDVERLTRIGRVIERAEAVGLTVNTRAVAAMWNALEAGDRWRLVLEA